MIIRENDLTDLWHRSCERLMLAHRDEVDIANGGYIVTYNNVLVAESMDFDFDIGLDSWLTMQRWRKLQRDYLMHEEVVPFIERSAEVAQKRGRTGVNTQMFFRQVHRDKVVRSHVWGNCLMAITYQGGRYSRPTIVVHSRTAFLAFLGGLDISLCLCLARLIADASGQDVRDFQFRWYLDSIAWSSFKSVAFVMANGHYDTVMDEETYPDKEYPSVTISRFWIKRLRDNPPEFFKFGQANRMSKRWQLAINGEGFPSIHSDDLVLLPEFLGGEIPRNIKRRQQAAEEE